MSEEPAPPEEESYDADWKILRRGYEDVATTMNLAVGMERLTRALTQFFDQEGIFKKLVVGGQKAKPPHKFHLYLVQEPAKEKSLGLVWRFMIQGVEEIEMFTEVNQSPFFNEIDEAFEWTFNRVFAALTQYEIEFEALVQEEEDLLSEKKLRLMRFKRLKQGMGQYDLDQQPLPFSGDGGT